MRSVVTACKEPAATPGAVACLGTGADADGMPMNPVTSAMRRSGRERFRSDTAWGSGLKLADALHDHVQQELLVGRPML